MKVQLEYNNQNIGIRQALQKPEIGNKLTLKGELGTELNLVVSEVIELNNQDAKYKVVLQ